MARTVLTYGSLNLNDGTTWALRPGFDPGAPVKSWDERRSYVGRLAQRNVTEAQLIEMFIPLILRSSTLAGLRTEVADLNDLIDAGEQTLVFDTVVYSCAHSQRVSVLYSAPVLSTLTALIEFTPVRYPDADESS